MIAEAIQKMAGTLQFEVPDSTPSRLASLPTFRPAKPQPPVRTSAPAAPSPEVQALKAELAELKNLIRETLMAKSSTPSSPSSESQAAIQAPAPSPPEPIVAKTVTSPLPAVPVVSATSLDAAPPAVPPSTASVGSSGPVTLPNTLAERLAWYDPWKTFRDSVWRTGAYRVDRWQPEMVEEVRATFKQLVADPKFLRTIEAAVREIEPSVPPENLFRYVASVAGWLSWATYANQKYGQSS